MPKNTKNIQSEEANKVIQMMTVMPSKLKSADVDTYRNAVNQAKLGFPSRWFELIENLMSDGFLLDQIDKFVGMVTNAEIQFQIDGKAVDVINDIIDTPEFEELISEIAKSKLFGKSVVNTSFVPEFSVFSFPRRNLITKNVLRPLAERENLIVEREGMLTGYNYSQDKFVLEFGRDGDLGKLFGVAQYVIYKRGNFGDWAQYAEIFGMPFIVGKYNSTDVKARDQLFEALAEIGGKPVAAVPKETDMEVVFGTGTGSSDLYKALRDACNEEIMIGILGETMTTVSGSSHSQSETHRDTFDDKAKALCRYVQRMLNKKFVPLLAERGYPVAGGKFVFPDARIDITVDNLIQLSKVLKIPAKFAHEKYAIPMADSGDELMGSPVAEPANNNVQPPPTTTTPAGKGSDMSKKENNKKLKLSDSEKGFLRMCVDFFANARTLGSRAISSVLNLADKSTSYTAGIDIKGLFEDALKDIYAKQGVEPQDVAATVSKPLFDITNKTLQRGIDKTFSVEFGKTDPEFIQQFKENAAVFSAFKAHKQGNEIVAQLIDENGNLRSYYDFRKAVLGTTIAADYNENWLKTEYNMAVRSARMAERFKGFLKTAHIYPNLKYLPSRSAHPREAHKPFYGVILPITHEWWKTHMPPSEWGCECDVENTDEEATAVPAEADNNTSPVFDNNPGETGEFINIKAHPYVKDVTDEEVINSIIEFAKLNVDDEWETIKTKNGLLRVSDAHGKNERSDNVKLATYLANKYGFEIDLLATDNNKKTADSFNKTLGIKQEYKHNIKATVSAIDNELREGKSQADHIVLNIESKIKIGDLVNGIKGRVRRAENIKTVWVRIGKFDRQYTREEILSPGWKIQRD